jgi:hypothetical protein
MKLGGKEMKKLTVTLTVAEENDCKAARYATAADPKNRTIACVDTEFLGSIYEFVASVEELFHEDWERIRFEMAGLQSPDTPLEPNGQILSRYHAAFLKSYQELKDQLYKKQVRVVIDDPKDENPMGEGLSKPH